MTQSFAGCASTAAARSNCVLQRTPGTYYVLTYHRGPAPLNTALGIMKKLALLLLLSATANAHAVELTCPTTVRIDAHIVDPPAPWQSYLRKTLTPSGEVPAEGKLVGVGFVSGPPDSNFILAPDNSAQADCDERQCVNHWIFASSERETWVTCEYGTGLPHLVIPLPKGATACHVSYGKSAKGPLRAWCTP